MWKYRSFLCAIVSITLFAQCDGVKDNGSDIASAPIKVIFETDMGNDIDDALALDMLFKYMDDEVIDLLAIMNNKGSDYSTHFIDMMCTWYGYPDIEIGRIENGVTIDDYVDYAKNVFDIKEEGRTLFKESKEDHGALMQSHDLYRKVLSEQPDTSVTIISVGFSTNLARLLGSSADQYAPLDGVELIKKKVKLLSVMGGSFGESKRKEFNIINDVESAQAVFEKWPTKIILSPFEVGRKILFPAKAIEENFSWSNRHPLVYAYHSYRPMPYDRPTWDLTSVLVVAEPTEDFFHFSKPGFISVTAEGYTNFESGENGRDIVLSVDSLQADNVKNYFIDLISRPPKSKI